MIAALNRLVEYIDGHLTEEIDIAGLATGVGTTESQVKSAEQTAQATFARYEAGFGSLLDLITAQQDE